MQLTATRPDNRVYHATDWVPEPKSGPATLVPMAFPDDPAEDRRSETGWNLTNRDEMTSELVGYAFHDLAVTDAGAHSTFYAGRDFDAAVHAASILTHERSSDHGAVAVLQARDGAYYLTRPTYHSGTSVYTLDIEQEWGSQVRPESRMIKAIVQADQWIDTRS